jgi:DnaJ-class molecular chaperone
MTVLTLERGQSFQELAFECEDDQITIRASRSTQMDGHSRLTLDDLITGVWEGLALHETVRCPACGGTMTSRPAAGGGEAHEGSCVDCGVVLA